MFENYLKIALRNILKNKGYSLINIVGLAIGMTAFLLIALYVRHELSYDQFHQKANRVFRVVNKTSEGEVGFARTAPILATMLLDNFPEVERSIRLKKWSATISKNGKQFHESKFYFSEPAIFELFSFEIIAGDLETALSEPNTVLITQTVAQKYFGDQQPLGKTLALNDSTDLQITGVIKDIPENSHFSAEFIASFKTYESFTDPKWLNTWRSSIYYTYVLLEENHSAAAFEEKFAAQNIRSDFGSKQQRFIHLQPLTDIHLHSHLKHEMQPNGNLNYVYLFSLVAIFVLLIACVNFMNLATARGNQRAREVGVRKVMGAYRSKLIWQFLSESIISCFLALMFALILVEAILPYFNEFVNKQLNMGYQTNFYTLLVLIGLSLLVGIISGSYPAFYLSNFQPVKVLKGKFTASRLGSAVFFRKGLIVLQFVISISLIIGAGIVQQQMQYIQNQNLGFEEEQIVVLPFNWESSVQKKYQTIKDELLRNSMIMGVTASGDVPGRMMTTMGYQVETMPAEQWSGITMLVVDPDFSETYKASIIAGRDFSDELKTDVKNTFIINEAALAEIGWTSPEEAIGKKFKMNESGTIIGVVKDFHFNSLHEKIEPLVMTVWPSWFGYISVRIAPGSFNESLAFIQNTWQAHVPNQPFDFFFLDDDLNNQYMADRQFGQVFNSFSLLAIFIACIGLLGLTSYATEQRLKEISVRKILGASVAGITGLLSKDFLKLVCLANIIAWPLAYWVMTNWLQNFAYRTEMSFSVFILAGVIAGAIAFIAVGFQAVKAALRNPIESLRYE